ncbi:MAG: CDP-alcohol phosphatidyltransferase family protein [Heliobacteriaceae bacterium]|jgi:phosphatidylglycerophosphate synthase|nr:CDP-alcohol phosphatidyltransferase family protein [Heliobacteriaceae bacterium]
MANLISILRIFIAFWAIGLLFAQSYIWALILTIIAFAMDGLDGWVARKLNETSGLGAVLDIMGDRIVEASYWIAFAALGRLSVLFPLICVTRAFVTDSLRSVALSQGYTAFGEKSMQSSKIGYFICSSKFMRISYAVAKVLAFILLIAAQIYPVLYIPALTFACAAVIFCVVRALPVIFESGKLFRHD